MVPRRPPILGLTHSLKQLLEQHFFVDPGQSQSNIHSSESDTQGPGGGDSWDGQVPDRGLAVEIKQEKSQ